MLLVDHEIRKLSLRGFPLSPFNVESDEIFYMIAPFSEGVQDGGVISYGLSHAGYDLRLGNELLVFKNSWNEIIDPKRFKEEDYRNRVFDRITPRESFSDRTMERDKDGNVSVKTGGKFYIIPAHSYALGASLEHLHIPPWIKGRCVGKSTMARCGLLINTTPLEPGWKGHLTIEISNISPCPALVYAEEGIAQLEFEMLNSCPERDYEQKQGKYQSQGASPVPARVKE